MHTIEKKQSGALIEQNAANNTVSFGASIAFTPAAVELLDKSHLSKTFIGLVVYDSDGQRVTTKTDFITRAARKDWEQLHVSYKIKRDGFVEIVGNKHRNSEVLLIENSQNKWIQFTKRGSSKSVSSARSSNPVTVGPDQPMTQDICIERYWCTDGGCELISTTCYPHDNVGDDTGGSGGDPSYQDPGPKVGINEKNRDPNTGELLYRTYEGETYKVLGSIHTHPATSIGNPQLPSTADRGDEMCRTYGTPMYIMGAEGITEYNNDGSLGVRWTPAQISGCNGAIF